MSGEELRIGIVGGSGMLGQAISKALLEAKIVPSQRFWISNRSGQTELSEAYPNLKKTQDKQQLVEACDVVILSVPPAAVEQIAITAPDKLVISVMAGVSLERLQAITGSRRVIRAMSSPAAQDTLAYSPWCAGEGVTEDDRKITQTLFQACGLSDEVETEAQIEYFTALTGPVPGFVAFFAKAMVDYAIARDIPSNLADRSIRQLFLAAGHTMSDGQMTPADYVDEMISYAGTTAAGLAALEQSTVSDDIATALDAAVERTRTIG